MVESVFPTLCSVMGFPGGSDGEVSACNVRDPGLNPGSGRFLGEGNGKPLQYSCWRIPWTEEPDGYSPWGRKESDMTERLPPPPPPFLSQEVNEGLLSPFQSNIIISSTKAECSLLISVDILFPFRTVYSPFHISKGTWIVVLSFYYQNLKFKG